MIELLYHVPGLEGLQQVASDFGVEITAHGGLARRLYSRMLLRPKGEDPDLFELTPFTADIDLTHSGEAVKGAQIMREIVRVVPFAECFRWELRSDSEDQAFRDSTVHNSNIPVTRVRLSTRSGFNDPAGAREDILSSRYRFERNPAYQKSTLFRAGRDLEAFGAILYVRTLFDAELGEALVEQPGLDAVEKVLREGMSEDTRARLLGSAYLRMRLHYLLKGLAAVTCTSTERSLVIRTGVREFASFADGHQDPPKRDEQTPNRNLRVTRAPDLEPEKSGELSSHFAEDLNLDTESAITASQHIGGDSFRLPARVPFYIMRSPEAKRRSAFEQLKDGKNILAEGVEPLRSSAWIRVSPGKARSSRVVSGPTNEMMHFAMIDPEVAPGSRSGPLDEDLSMLMFLQRGGSSGTLYVAAPLVTCSSRAYVIRGEQRGVVRCFRLACGSLLERLLDDGETSELRIALVSATRRIDGTVSPARGGAPKKRATGGDGVKVTKKRPAIASEDSEVEVAKSALRKRRAAEKEGLKA